MGKNKIVSAFLALSIMLTGVLSGCIKEGKEEVKENVSLVETDDLSGKSVIENTADSTSQTDKMYADYLKEQRLCTISKGFRIIEPGVAKDNPNGLAGAVKYDFDGDKTDELVTFTFERNEKNGEDIRIDLLKDSGGDLKVTDSKYLTEMLEINDSEGNIKSDTIFFKDVISMQLVTSEYQDSLYFGFVLSNDNYFCRPNPPREYMKSMSVFTVEENQITPCMIAGTYQNHSIYGSDEDQGVLYATLLPPSIRNTTGDLGECRVKEEVFEGDTREKRIREQSEEIITEINEAVRNKGHYTLFANLHSVISELEYCIGGGLYDSATSAYSALLNEFGLDMEYNGYGEENNLECTAKFVSKNQSDIKTILEIDAVRGYINDYETEYYERNPFKANKLILNSDLEEILEEESLYIQPFADELALYEDILRYPHYYRDVWDDFHELCNDSESDISPYYCVADINKDNKYEMILTAGTDSSSCVCHVSIVLSDGSVRSYKFYGEASFYDSGKFMLRESSAYGPASYYSLNDDSHWSSCPQKQEDYSLISAVWNENDTSENRESYRGEEADKKIAELCSGSPIIPEFNRYSLYYPDEFKDMVVVEDVSDITYTWQKAYLDTINENTSCSDLEYSLINIDDDDIPELVVGDPIDSRSGGLYTFSNGAVSMLTGLTMREYMDGYVDKQGIFGVKWWWLEKEGYSFYKIENGVANKFDSLQIEHSADNDIYTINDKSVTGEQYQNKYKECSNKFTKVTYVGYDEIIKQLNSKE